MQTGSQLSALITLELQSQNNFLSSQLIKLLNGAI